MQDFLNLLMVSRETIEVVMIALYKNNDKINFDNH